MLFKTRYIWEEKMEIQEIGKDDEDKNYGYMLTINWISKSSKDEAFRKDLYRSKLRDIGINLNILKKQESWSNKAFKDIKY